MKPWIAIAAAMTLALSLDAQAAEPAGACHIGAYQLPDGAIVIAATFRGHPGDVAAIQTEKFVVGYATVLVLNVSRKLERRLLVGSRANPAGNCKGDSFEVEPGSWKSPRRHGRLRGVAVVERFAGECGPLHPLVKGATQGLRIDSQ